MAFQEWLYRKAEQNAHSEILAFLMMILGMNLLIGGLIVTVILSGGPNFLFYISQPLSQSAVIGLVLTLAGFLILSVGFVLVIHYDRQRSWHLNEIEKSARHGKVSIGVGKPDELLESSASKDCEE